MVIIKLSCSTIVKEWQLKELKGDELITKVIMSLDEFADKILFNVSCEEFEKWFPDFDDKNEEMVTDKECINEVWNQCINYGFIPDDFDILHNYIDKMEVTH